MAGELQYARNGDIQLAYRILGKGPVDVLFVPIWFSNLDLIEDLPVMSRLFEGLGSFSRLTMWDRRGAGLSDRLCGPATLEEGMDDALAVMDAAGVERSALIGFNESATLSCLLAATHPQRVSHLILYGSYATTTWKPDYPWGQKPEERDEQVQWVCANWGTRELAEIMFAGADERVLRFGARWQRAAVSRDALPRFYEMLSHTDVRHVLPSIVVPTLVLHRKDDWAVPVDNGRFIASQIPGAKFVELDGADHAPFLGDSDALLEEMEEFLTGTRRPRGSDRVLATILFTDIVDSTIAASDMGDERWRRLLDEHDEVTRATLERFQGRLVKSIGDGALATFDGPARAINCACALREALSNIGISIRAGLHTGEVEVRGDDVGGIAVHIGSRVAGLARAGELLVSQSIPPLVAGSGIEFVSRGAHELKGIEGDWQIYAVVDN